MLYSLGVGVKHLAIPVVALAFFLGVQGLLAPNPTSVRQEGAVAKEGTIHGVVRITRHPFLWGVAMWAAFHVAANGNLASVIFFGTFLVLSIVGTFSIDAKRKRKLGAAWTEFASQDVEHSLRRGACAAIRCASAKVSVGVSAWRCWCSWPCCSAMRISSTCRRSPTAGCRINDETDLIFTALAGW